MLSALTNKIESHRHSNKLPWKFLVSGKDFLWKIAKDKRLRCIYQDKDERWLLDNSEERMDTSKHIFDETRRMFHLDRYRFALRYVKDKTVADIACGTGYGTKMITVDGNAKNTFGIDIDKETIAYVKKHHHAPNISYICTSADSSVLLDKSIDTLISFETIEHVKDNTALLQEFYRILKSGGILACSTPNQCPVEIAKYHVHMYLLESFKSLLSRYFKIIGMYNQNSGNDNKSWGNHDQPRGIVKTSSKNSKLAECYIAICQKVI
jgi:2-polyprenyl-3-methyl-5-hydroxy-6-metoxy-1,4-benzoquinol methylase